MKTNLLKCGKNLLSIILAVCLIVSVCSTGISFAASAEDGTTDDPSVLYWDGNTASEGDITLLVEGVKNSVDNPYIIETPAEMAWLQQAGAATAGKYYRIADGITAFYFNAGVKDLNGAGEVENYFNKTLDTLHKSYASSGAPFAGYFDGNGCTFYGVYSVPASGDNAGGVFARVGGTATVRNINVSKSFLASSNYAGGITAMGASGGTYNIELCSVTDSYISGANESAGIIGYSSGSSYITGCLVAANDIVANKNVGGFVARVGSSTVTVVDSVCIGSAADTNESASIAKLKFLNVYTDTKSNSSATGINLVPSTSISGDAAKTAMPYLTWGLGWQAGEKYPTIRSSIRRYVIWDGTTSDTTWTGGGSEADPYIITSAAELHGMVASFGKSGSYFEVSDEIDFFIINPVYGMDASAAKAYLKNTGITKQEWFKYTGTNATGTAFSGHFNGNGATIVGLYSYHSDTSSASTGFIGLLRETTSTTVKNVAFDKCYSYNARTVANSIWANGIIFGGVNTNAANVEVENVQVTNSVAESEGASSGLIAGCYKGANLSVKNFVASGNEISAGAGQLGALTGYTENVTAKVENFICSDDIFVAGRPVSSGFTSYKATNVYTASSAPKADTYTAIVTQDNMKGYAAYKNMAALDWLNTFTADDGSLPELKLFKYGSARYYSGGSGTQNDPYLISNAIDLQMMVKFLGYIPQGSAGAYTIGTTQAYHKLTKDVYINDVKNMSVSDALNGGLTLIWDNTDLNGTKGAAASSIFAGVVDGDFHTVYGIYKTDTTSNSRGGLLYNIGNNAKFSNIAIRKSNIKGYHAGAFAAQHGGSSCTGSVTFYNCAVLETKLQSTITGNGGAAGFVPYGSANSGYKMEFEKCLFVADEVATITSVEGTTSSLGGFTAVSWSGGGRHFTDCVSIGAYPYDQRLADSGKNSCNSATTYTNVLTDYDITTATAYSTLTDDQKAVLGNVSYLPADGDTNQSWVEVDYDTYLSNAGWEIDPADFVKENYTVWSGDTADAYESGSGTADAPYIIANAEQLHKMVVDLGMVDGAAAHFKVSDELAEKGIYLNARAKNFDAATVGESPYTNNWMDGQTTGSDFVGTFDGNGVTIYGLYASSDQASGFISRAGNATIKNVNFEEAYVVCSNTSTARGAGIVVGRGSSAGTSINITECRVENSYANGAYAAAALIGNSVSSTVSVSTCFIAENNIIGATYAGGVAGDVWTLEVGTVSNTVSLGIHVSPNKSGAFTCTNCYSDTENSVGEVAGVEVDEDGTYTGAAAVITMPNLPWYEGWMPGAEGEYPYFGSLGYKVWSGGTAEAYESGLGTANAPYIIANAEQLHKMVVDLGMVDGVAAHFKVSDELAKKGIYLNVLVDDFDADTVGATSPYTNNWMDGQTNAAFVGTFDGNGATIYGLYASSDTNIGVGFISRIGNATIKNISFEEAYVVSTQATSAAYGSGVIAGRGDGSKTNNLTKCRVENCYVNDANYSAGGLIGDGRGDNLIITTCFIADNSITAGTAYGAIYGDCYGTTRTVSDTVMLGCAPTSSANALTFTNCYSDVASATGLEPISAGAAVKGSEARATMPNLSWDINWTTVENDYPAFMEVDYAYWNGTSDTNWAGSGTEEQPYIIESAEQLHGMVVVLGKNPTTGEPAHFKVSDELAQKGIYLNVRVSNFDATTVSKSPYTNNWMDGQSNTAFEGTFDGNGATIYGLYASSTTNIGVGFISRTGNATIKNVSFKEAYVVSDQTLSSAYGAGVIAGRGDASSTLNLTKCRVENCYVEDVNYRAGALIGNGRGDNLIITTCFIADNAINAGTAYGAIYGDCYGTTRTVSDTIMLGCVPTSSANTLTFTNCYSDVTSAEGLEQISAGAAVKGDDARTTMPNLSWNINWTTVENDYPAFMELDYAYWNGTAATDWAGSGTEKDPYIIETAEQLYGMVQQKGIVNGKAAYFKVSDELAEKGIYLNPIKDMALSEAQTYMKGSGQNWSKTYIRPTAEDEALASAFVGKFDGNGATIYGMYSSTVNVTTYRSGTGFISIAGDGAVIKNIRFDMPYVTTTGGSAATVISDISGEYVSVAIANVAVTNAYVTNSNYSPTSTNVGVGGIVFTHLAPKLVITNCLFEGEIINLQATNLENFGGIAATSNFKYATAIDITSCVSVGYKPVGTVSENYIITNTYTNKTQDLTGVITTNNLTKAGMPALDWTQWSDEKTLPTEYGNVPMPLKNDNWEFVSWKRTGALSDGLIADYSVFDGGNGSSTEPYGISTGDQLYKAILTGGQRYGTPLHFKLTADIDLAGVAWITSDVDYYTAFSGILNGDGHTIKGLNSATHSGEYAGLIPQLAAGAVVENIHIDGAYVYAVNAGGISGGVAGEAATTISASSVTDGQIEGTVAGGIIGKAGAATITDVFFTGTASYGIAGTANATITNAYVSGPADISAAETESETAYIAGVDTFNAGILGDNWYQGNTANKLPRLKNQAAAREYLDIAGDGDTIGYNVDDLTSLRSKLLYRSAYSYIYGDITYDSGIDIRDLMILKRTMGDNYADIDEGFWPNLAQGEYTIIYGESDNRDAALKLQRFFAEFVGVDIEVVDATNATYPASQLIIVGDVDGKFTNGLGDINKYAITYNEDGTNYNLWFKADLVTGVEQAVEEFITNAEYGSTVYTCEATSVSENKTATTVDGVVYNYVWGDEFNDTYTNASNTSKNYFNFNNWRIAHQKEYWNDIDVALPEDMGLFNYISDGKLVMHNDVSKSYWTDKTDASNGYETNGSDGNSWTYATGGVMSTAKSMLFKRGYVELYAKVPTAQNAWPAWWLYTGSFTTNAGVDSSLYSKVFDLNPDYVATTTDKLDPTNSTTYKYKLPYASIEIDIFELMNSSEKLWFWMTSNYNYSMNIHKRYKNTYNADNDSVYDTFGTGNSINSSELSSGSFTSRNNGYTGEYTFSVNKSCSTQKQTYEDRTYSFLWDENQLTMWDNVNSTKKTVSIAGDNDFDVFVYMLLDNHFFSPGSSFNDTENVPSEDMIVDYVRLYQKPGERELITPDSEARNQ